MECQKLVRMITHNSDNTYSPPSPRSKHTMVTTSELFRASNALDSRQTGRLQDESMTQDIDPETATENWLMNERREVADSTHANYSTLAVKWCQFCQEHEIESMAEVSGRTLMRFKSWRGEQVKLSTVGQNLSALRRFIAYCEKIEAVKSGLIDKVPDVRAPDNTRDEKLDPDIAEAVLEYLRKFDYASRRHAITELVWHTAFRTATLRSVDVEDCVLDSDTPHIKLQNRPDKDTRLKNGEKSEREVSISDTVAEVLQDYIDHDRFDVTGDHGRNPLLTTRQGRASKNTLRRDIRTATRPCEYKDECPYDKDPAECQARSNRHKAGDCEGVTTGHPLRRGSITHAHLDRDVPKRVVSDRCDVSEKILVKHYDRQQESRKRELRREYLEDM